MATAVITSLIIIVISLFAAGTWWWFRSSTKAPDVAITIPISGNMLILSPSDIVKAGTSKGAISNQTAYDMYFGDSAVLVRSFPNSFDFSGAKPVSISGNQIDALSAITQYPAWKTDGDLLGVVFVNIVGETSGTLVFSGGAIMPWTKTGLAITLGTMTLKAYAGPILVITDKNISYNFTPAAKKL